MPARNGVYTAGIQLAAYCATTFGAELHALDKNIHSAYFVVALLALSSCGSADAPAPFINQSGGADTPTIPTPTDYPR